MDIGWFPRQNEWFQRHWNRMLVVIISVLLVQALYNGGAQWKRNDPSWDVLYHTGGNGPWIQKIHGVVSNDIVPPEWCSVHQVHMMSRHAERYPTANAGNRMLALVRRIKASNIIFAGDLDFLNSWQYFAIDPAENHDKLTTTGTYAGTLSSFRTGTRLRSRYWHLLSPRGNEKKTSLWASDSERVIETAKHFASGLWGLDWASRHAELHIVPEILDLGADTLTPRDTCVAYLNDKELGRDYGYKQLYSFRDTYLPIIHARLHAQYQGISFTNSELYSMQEMCGFETLVRGSSPWCNVFTPEEWRSFEYARDVKHYYTAGPGNRFGPTMGWLWLNATAHLLALGPDAGRSFFSFVHDGDLLPMLAALDLFPLNTTLSVTQRLEPRNWRTSQIVPMSGRIIFELLDCGSTTDLQHEDEDVPLPHNQAMPRASRRQLQSEQPRGRFVRINVNDGIVALPGCDSGPGSSCPLEEFLAHVKRRGDEVGDFREMCELGEDVAERITFLHQ